MTGGGGGRFARENFDRDGYQRALTEFRDVLEHVEVVGWPKRDAELHELRLLVAKYPSEAEAFLAEQKRDTHP